MTHLRLAEFQVRLLLCTPAQRRSPQLYWRCGCRARECAYRKYDVLPCAYHEPLLSEIQEGEDRLYDSFTAPALSDPRGRLA